MVQSPQKIKEMIEELIPDQFELQAMFFYSIFDRLVCLDKNTIQRYLLMLKIETESERDIIFTLISQYVEILDWAYLGVGFYNIEISKLEEKE